MEESKSMGSIDSIQSHSRCVIAVFCRSICRWNPDNNPVSPEKPPEVSTISRVTLSRRATRCIAAGAFYFDGISRAESPRTGSR